MYRLGSAMVDAATKHTPPRWEPRAAFGVGEQVLAKAADLARAEPMPSLLAGEIALVRGTVAAASENWSHALTQLQLAKQHLSDEWIQNKLGRGSGKRPNSQSTFYCRSLLDIVFARQINC